MMRSEPVAKRGDKHPTQEEGHGQAEPARPRDPSSSGREGRLHEVGADRGGAKKKPPSAERRKHLTELLKRQEAEVAALRKERDAAAKTKS